MEIHSSTPDRFIEDFCFEELEKEMGSAWLIEKMFSNGTIQDLKAIRKYYGDERIKKEVIQIQWLSKESVSFFSGLYEIPKEDFMTYKLIHKLI